MRNQKQRSHSFPDPSESLLNSWTGETPPLSQSSHGKFINHSNSWDGETGLHATSKSVHRLRRRALSEHGKTLLLHAYSLPAFPILRTHANTGKQKTENRSQAGKVGKPERETRNYFEVLSVSHKSLISKDSGKHRSRKPQASNTLLANGKLQEDVADEEEGWKKVTHLKYKPSKNRHGSPGVPSNSHNNPLDPYGSAADQDGMHEFSNMEQDISRSRVWGKKKKSRQFKAVKQRNYAMEKRAEQRKGNR